jgi:hypothetical protein
MINTLQTVKHFALYDTWVLRYQIEQKTIATNAHIAKLKTTSRQAIRRLQHGRR